VGAAISRHKRGGRIEERDGKLYGTNSTRTEQGIGLDTGMKKIAGRPQKELGNGMGSSLS
jgi:hypothetical protein